MLQPTVGERIVSRLQGFTEELRTNQVRSYPFAPTGVRRVRYVRIVDYVPRVIDVDDDKVGFDKGGF